VACIEKRAEGPELAAEGEDLLGNALGGSRDYESLERAFERELGVRLLGAIAKHTETSECREFGHHDSEVEAVSAVLLVGIANRGLRVVGNEDATRESPSGWVG
jgi:hypothetical protein